MVLRRRLEKKNFPVTHWEDKLLRVQRLFSNLAEVEVEVGGGAK